MEGQHSKDSTLKTEEEIKSDSEILDFNNPAFKFIPKGYHEWIQRGYYLVCKSCELEHGVFIGSHKLMVGRKEDGTPILKTRKELGYA
jgi:hypothetical protein